MKKDGVFDEKIQGVLDDINTLDFDRKKTDIDSDRAKAAEILYYIKQKLAIVSKTRNLEFDPREQFRKAIDIAKKVGDPQFLNAIYDEIIKIHEEAGYCYDGAIIAIEAGQKDKALSLIQKFIEADGVGALEIAEKVDDKFVERVRQLMQDKEKKVQDEAMSHFEKEQHLSEVRYHTKSGSIYQINQDGFIFRNGTPFILGGTVFKFFGIADKKQAHDSRWEVGAYGSAYDDWKISQVAYLANKRDNFVKPIPFTEVGKYVGTDYCLVGINEEKKEIVITTPLVNG